MSVIIDADNEGLQIAFSASQWTVLGWAKLTADVNRYSTIFDVSASTSNYMQFSTDNGGQLLGIHLTSGGVDSISLTPGQWYRVAIRRDATNFTLLVAGTTGALGTYTVAVLGSYAPTTLRVGRSVWSGEPWNGPLAGFKVYTAALSDGDVATELTRPEAIRTADLWATYNLDAPPGTADTSGNGRTLTAGSAAVTDSADLPPYAAAVPTPATVLNIGTGAGQNHFKLQVARTGDGAVLTKTLAELAAGYTEAPYWYTTSDGLRVHTEARLDAPTTAGSSFSRCELREADASGADYSWDPTFGEHVMEGTTTITSMAPVKPDVVIAQIFHEGLTADVASIRTQLVSGTIRLRFRFNGVSVTSPQMAAPYAPGTEFAWRMRVVSGVVEVYWAFGGAALPGTPQITTAAIPAGVCYFKAGLYNQSNVAAGDAGTAIGASELRALAVDHVIPVGKITEVVAGVPALTVSGANPAVTPALPANCTVQDMLVVHDVVVAQASGAVANQPATPDGWQVRDSFVAAGTLGGQIRETWFYRPWTADVVAPVIALTGVSGVQHRAVVVRLRGAKLSGDPTDVLGAQTSPATSATVMGPITGLIPTKFGSAVLLGAVRENDLTDSVAIAITAQQSGVPFTVLDSFGAVGSDNMAGALAYSLLDAPVAVTDKSFSATATAAQKSIGQMWAVAALADSSVPLWVGNLETGDLSQFNTQNGGDRETPNEVVVVSSPVRLGSFARRSTVNATTTQSGSQQRAETETQFRDVAAGDNLWFGMSTQLLPGFPTNPGAFQLVQQWKNAGSGSPPLALHVENGRYELQGGFGYPGGARSMPSQLLGTATTGVWDDWLFDIQFREGPDAGLISIWRNGVQMLTNYVPPGGTLYPGLVSYLKIGLYRGTAAAVPASVVHDEMRIGLTRESVEIAQLAQSDSGAFFPFFF